MEDVGARTGQPAFTEREMELSEWFAVEPEFIRALTDIVERIRQTNVTRSMNPLICQRFPTSRFDTDGYYRVTC
jgi:hypothetical protein